MILTHRNCAPIQIVVSRYFHYRRLNWTPYMAWGLAMTRSHDLHNRMAK